MSLPKLEHPGFDVTIPSNKKIVRFRPYTVREQKILLLLKESTETVEITNLLIELIESCCLGNIEAKKLAYFDIEYIFLRLRSKSVQESVDLSYKCNNTVNDILCGKINTYSIDLESINVDLSNRDNTINIDNNNNPISIEMNYPTIFSIKSIEEYNSTRNVELLLNTIANDLESITDINNAIKYDSFTRIEIIEYLKDLPLEAFDKFLQFYNNMPTLTKNIDYKCSKCGFTEVITLSGLIDFFV